MKKKKEDGSLVKMKKELTDQRKLRERIKGIIEEFEKRGS